MKVYEITCPCGPPRRFRLFRAAHAAMKRHTCPPVWVTNRCPSCTRSVPLLVEGSDLCLRCDALHFPDWSAA